MRNYLWFGILFLLSVYAPGHSFDFPRTAAGNSSVLEKAMPVLADQVSASYKEEDRIKYLDNAFRLQMVAGKYGDALATVASLRQLLRAQMVIPSKAPTSGRRLKQSPRQSRVSHSTMPIPRCFANVLLSLRTGRQPRSSARMHSLIWRICSVTCRTISRSAKIPTRFPCLMP